MLGPDRRTLLLDALRPPEGYAFNEAIGTTYTLDLQALLTAPLAFTVFDWEDREGRPTDDPLILLGSLRSHAERISIFCQAGRIAVPAKHQPLFGYLERAVHEVGAPHEDGVFHAKLWLLRYTEAEGGVVYRLLCLSRNLTFDRSWDTALVLDGPLTGRTTAIAANHPLGDLVAALPELAVRPLPEEVRDRVDRMQHEVRRVRFEPPIGIDEVAFWPLGIAGRRRWPFEDNRRRMLVVSPFASASTLARMTDGRTDCVLVSREDTLAGLAPAVLDRFTRVYCLQSEMGVEEEQEEEAENVGSLRGLHAKLFVMDDGWRARLWTGSANATEAAFNRNVELLVELRGAKAVCGVDAVLGQRGEGMALLDLLTPFTAGEGVPEGEPGALDRAVEEVRRVLSGAGLRLVASASDHEQRLDLELRVAAGPELELPAGCAITCRPVSIGEEWRVTVTAGAEVAARFAGVSWQSLTSFVVFEVTVRSGDEEARAAFVLNLPLEGGPEDRHDRLLEAVLKDRSAVLRFLMLLLADEGLELAAVQAMYDAGGGVLRAELDPSFDVPLLEVMVRALYRDPAKLDRVARLVRDLRRTDAGRNLLPEGFEEVWEPIWQARVKELDGERP